ncbi:TPA: phage holin family protein [Cronobacter sakazakii]|uniref:phage holin family protein n=1 Tax=Cronobacter sakazakii TaxID=28141 RepID=UPI000978814B|nr:phage holin family protein [Cronobacter sakazakii]EIZ8816841.1 phage holin family protein [Cronobacter sakazakii]EJO9547597.1 phage holin family protein [Cronobacter sakazakii]EKF8821462.1 phage holin family protein [Cronobacter sakazakii]ELY4089579.1 phage holin family protein [Cronobacter sakazakii]ELY4224954.1 phage holin family protein [Cronobacter sakazakii]
MTNHELMLLVNAIICGAIACRVLFFKREGRRHRWWGGWLAYLLVVVTASIPIRTFYGAYMVADWSEVVINAIFLAAVLRTRGNVVQIFKESRS